MLEDKVKGIQQMDINPIHGMSYAVHANKWLMASKALLCPLVLTSFLASFVMKKGVEEMAGTSTKICSYIISVHLRDLDIKHNQSQYTTHFHTTHGYMAIEGSATLSECTFSGGRLNGTKCRNRLNSDVFDVTVAEKCVSERSHLARSVE